MELNTVSQPSGVQPTLSGPSTQQQDLSVVGAPTQPTLSGAPDSPATPSKMSVDAFADMIKGKYPEYQNADNNTLVKTILQKYPEYASKVDYTQQSVKKGFWQPLFDPTIGAIKGIGSTLTGLGQIGDKALGGITSMMGIKKTDNQKATEQSGADAIKSSLQPTNTAQKVGFGAEQVGEFLLPGSELIKGEKAIDAASKLINVGDKATALTQATARVLGKAGLEGITSGAVRFAQTGGNTNEAKKTALTFGLLKGVGGAFGEAAKSLGIPEKLYASVFKNNYENMYQKLKSEGLDAFHRTDPEQFQKLVESGAIKAAKDGSAVVDETLAQKALDAGLKGSLKNMSNQVVKNLAMSEGKVQQIANEIDGKAVSGAATTAKVGGPNAGKIMEQLSKPTNAIQLSTKEAKSYYNVLKDLADSYKDVNFGSISAKASDLAEKAKSGNLTVGDSLDMRRFLDKMRIQSSYNPVSGTKLSLGQMNLKGLTDTLRGKINSVPGMGKAMEDYSFNIDALESLAKAAVKQGNKEALGAIDQAMLGGGVLTGQEIPASMLTVAKKAMQSPGVKTTIGSKIQGSGIATMPGIGAKAATSRLFNTSPVSGPTQSPQ